MLLLSLALHFRRSLKARSCVWWRLTWRAAKAMPRSGWNSCEWWCRGWRRPRTMSPSCLEETQTWETLRQVVEWASEFKKKRNDYLSIYIFFLLAECNCCLLFLRWPRWVSPPVCATCGSNWESRNTVATHGTPKPTATRLFILSAASALTGSTSAQLPRTTSHVWPPITWPWWVWRSWTVDATPVITGGSTVASLLGRTVPDRTYLFPFFLISVCFFFYVHQTVIYCLKKRVLASSDGYFIFQCLLFEFLLY